jgi:sulfate transport system ATP-binding protein
MDRGRIEQTGTPEDVYERPGTSFVHEFIGESIIVPVIIDGGTIRYEGETVALDAQGQPSGSARLFVRPYEMAIVPVDQAPFRGTVRRMHGIGPGRRLEIALGLGAGETLIEVDATRAESVAIGQSVGLRPRQYRIFANA